MSDQLKTQGAQLGLAPDFIAGLISQFGPLVAQLLIQLIGSKLKLSAVEPHLSNDYKGVSWLKQLLISTLTQYTSEIEGWVLSGETTVTNALIGLLTQNNAVLATVLKGLQGKLVASEQQLTDQALAALIAALQPDK